MTLDALLEANKDRISNPNRIKVGDEIIIPVPVTEEVRPRRRPRRPSAPSYWGQFVLLRLQNTLQGVGAATVGGISCLSGPDAL